MVSELIDSWRKYRVTMGLEGKSVDSVLKEVRRQRDEIYAIHRRECEAVVLGKAQFRQLWEDCVRFRQLWKRDKSPLDKMEMPVMIFGLKVYDHPTFDGVLVLPKRND